MRPLFPIIGQNFPTFQRGSVHIFSFEKKMVINVNISIVILYYSFARCYYGGNWVKCTWISLSLLFLMTAFGSTIILKSKVELKRNGRAYDPKEIQ